MKSSIDPLLSITTVTDKSYKRNHFQSLESMFKDTQQTQKRLHKK